MIAVLATYALLLQGVLGFAVSGFGDSGAGPGGAFPICHQALATAGAHQPGAPNDHRHDHAACALCCAMHCGMALLAGVARPQDWPLVHAAPRLAFAASDAPRRQGVEAQPRGPPRLG